MQNYNEILNKLKDIVSQELGDKKIYDKDIAAALELNYNNFRKAKARGTVPYYEIMSFLAKRNISINWFFFNQLPESLIEPTSNYIILKYQKSVIASAGGGALNYGVNPEPLIIDKQLLDYINSSYKYTEVLQVFGESMEPDIKDGSLIFIDKRDTKPQNSFIYAVNTQDGFMVKRIGSHGLESINEDIHTDIKEYDVMGRVKGVFIKL